jgi:hypothetical protein
MTKHLSILSKLLAELLTKYLKKKRWIGHHHFSVKALMQLGSKSKASHDSKDVSIWK